MLLWYVMAMLISLDRCYPMRTFRFTITYLLFPFAALLTDSHI